MPQITALPESFDVKAVVFGAATQMGFEVLHDSKVLEAQAEELEEASSEISANPEVEDEDLGFYEDKDVALEEKPHEKIPKDSEKTETLDTIKIHGGETNKKNEDSYYSDDLQQPTIKETGPQKSSRPTIGPIISAFFSKISMMFSKGKPNIPMRGKFMIIPPPNSGNFDRIIFSLYATFKSNSNH